MAGRRIILSFLMLSMLVQGCAAAMSNASPAQQRRDPAPGTLSEIKKDCALCHLSVVVRKGASQLKKPIAFLCLDCHPGRKSPGEHRIDIVPAVQVTRLPLVEGKLACITCHDPHQNTYGNLLRMPERELCLECHPY